MGRKKRIGLIACGMLAAVAVLGAGCGGLDQENKNLLQVKADGKIIQVIVDDVQDSITGEELENYINESLAAFQNSGDSISLESCRVQNGKVNITLSYSSVSAYSAYNQVEAFVGTVKEAYDAGYDLEREFYSPGGAAVPYFMLPSLCTDCRVLILEENVSVELPGSLFLSTEEVTKGQDGTVLISGETDAAVPEIFRTTTLEPVFMIYQVK